MKKIVNMVFGMFVLVVFSGLAQALMPPMSPEDLVQESNLIVDGEILKVYSAGPKEENKCSINVPHKAMLQVLKTVKGTEFKAVVVKFTKTHYKDGCVGSPDHVHFVGEKGRFHLSCQLDECRLTHWNGVKNEDSIF